jgi:hypothetical protein
MLLLRDKFVYMRNSREMAVAALQAAHGFKYCGVYLSMVYIGYDRPCCSIAIDAIAAAEAGMTTKERRQARRAAAKEGSGNPAALTQRCMQAVRGHSTLASVVCEASVVGHHATCTLTFKVITLTVVLFGALQTALHMCCIHVTEVAAVYFSLHALLHKQ